MRVFELVYPIRDRQEPFKYCYAINEIVNGERVNIRNFTNENYKHEEGGLKAFEKFLGDLVIRTTLEGKTVKFKNRDC